MPTHRWEVALPVGNADCSQPGFVKDSWDTGDHFGGGDDGTVVTKTRGVPCGVLEVARRKSWNFCVIFGGRIWKNCNRVMKIVDFESALFHFWMVVCNPSKFQIPLPSRLVEINNQTCQECAKPRRARRRVKKVSRAAWDVAVWDLRRLWRFDERWQFFFLGRTRSREADYTIFHIVYIVPYLFGGICLKMMSVFGQAWRKRAKLQW